MAVVVSALLTVWLAVVEALPRKLASPAYVAVSVFAPTELNAIEHVPAATVAVQELVPSLTVTLPVGAVGLLPKAPVDPEVHRQPARRSPMWCSTASPRS